MIVLGDAICRRFFAFVSTPHRLAAAFLSGLLISSWWTYLAALAFSAASRPMLWGNLVFFITASVAITLLWRSPAKHLIETQIDPESTRFKKWDWIATGIFLAFACWLMFSTFSMSEGTLRIAHHQSSDFGSTVSIMQTFAQGHNFPTEYPHFSGDRIRYHFLFYFQAGNLEYLGLNPALSNNILSILSLMSMLILVMTLGAVAFGSRVVGRIGAALFFFHGSLSFIPYLYKHGANALQAVIEMRDFLPSGYAFRGETWGVWSQVVYVNQRHLASSVGVFLVVLVFLVIRYRQVPEGIPLRKRFGIWKDRGRGETVAPTNGEMLQDIHPDVAEIVTSTDGEPPAADEAVKDGSEADSAASEQESSPKGADLSIADPEHKENDREIAAEVLLSANQNDSTDEELSSREASDLESGQAEPGKTPREWIREGLVGIAPFIFSGVLLGLLPMWNGAVFAAAFAVLLFLFLLFPLRRQMVGLALATGVIALPQIYFLKTGLPDPGYSLYHWGYTLGDPTVFAAIEYLGFTFGFKWLLILIALIVGTLFHLRLMIAITSLIFVTFFFQFSPEALTNHKFLNIWLIIANLFVASGLWFLWNLKLLKSAIIGKIAAVILGVLITMGGVMDLFPIRNSFWTAFPYENDPLIQWIHENTDPKAVFLSYRYVNHPILLAGRRLFYGHPYYAWGAGYPTAERDVIYRKMFESQDAAEVFRLLKENGISYVAIDNQARKGDFIKKPNEFVYQAYFKTVFESPEGRYDNLKIYAVPDVPGSPNPAIPLPAEAQVAPANAFSGGEGNAGGQFSKPRGIATDSKGNLYVADTGNSRVQKFDTDGKFIAAFGIAGAGVGEIKEPNGVAVDAAGSIFVVDAANHKLIKFAPDGKFVKEWKGPEPGFYGPRDIAVGSNKQLYIVDQGRTRIVIFDPATEAFSEWGTRGSGEGQFLESTGIAVGGGFVFVADNGNSRIQVFDLDGKFVRQWEVAIWERYVWNYPDIAFDEQAKRLYVTNGWKNEIVAFDVDGNPVDFGIVTDNADRLDNPTSLSVTEANKKRRLLVLNTNGSKVSVFELEAKTAK